MGRRGMGSTGVRKVASPGQCVSSSSWSGMCMGLEDDLLMLMQSLRL